MRNIIFTLLCASALVVQFARADVSNPSDDICVLPDNAPAVSATALTVKTSSDGKLVGSIVSTKLWKGFPVGALSILASEAVVKIVENGVISYSGNNFLIVLPSNNNDGYMKAAIDGHHVDSVIYARKARRKIWPELKCELIH